MEDITEYGIGFSVDKKAYNQIMKFESRINAMYEKMSKSGLKSAEAQTKTAVQSEKAKIKAQEASERKQKQIQAKALKDAKRLEDNRLRVFRSASFEKLTLEQKMNLTRILKNAKTVEELKDQERKLTTFYKRENKRRDKMLRNKSSATGGDSITGSSGGGIFAVAGDRLAAAMMNPITSAAVGVAAIISGSVSMLKQGNQQFEDLRAASSRTGGSIVGLQKSAFIAQSVAGREYSLDKIADMAADLQEKAGEVMSEGTISKEGIVTGGGTGMDFVNPLIRSGVIEPTMEAVKDYLKESDPVKLMDKIRTDINKSVTDKNQRRFALEAVSDFAKLNNALEENKERVKALEKEYDKNLSINPANINSLKELNNTFNTIGASIENLSLKFTEGFSTMLSEETLNMLGDASTGLNSLFYWVGKIIGGVVEFIAILKRFLDVIARVLAPFNAFNLSMDKMSWQIDKTKEAVDSFKKAFDDLIHWIVDKVYKLSNIMSDTFYNFKDSLGDAVSSSINATKDFFGFGDTNISNTTYMSNPINNIPSNTETQTRLNKNQNAGHPTQVVLQVDKEKLGSVVIDTNSFEGGVGNILYPIFR